MEWQIFYFDRPLTVVGLTIMDEKTYIKLLSSQEWESIYPKLTYYARWQTRIKGIPLDRAEDLASEAMNRTFQGERRWNPVKIGILPYLKGVVRSIANHLVESVEYQRKQSDVREDQSQSIIETFPTTDPTPVDEIEKEELLNFLLNSAGDDENMQLVILCLDEGQRGQEIANSLDMDIREVNNKMKKIRRAAREYLTTFKE